MKHEIKDKLILQANSIAESRYDMKTLEHDLFIAMLTQVHPDDDDKTEYSFRLTDLEKLAGKRYKYKDVKNACLSLMDRKIGIDRGENVGFKYYNFVDMSEYDPTTKMVTIVMTASIRPYFVNLRKHFHFYQLSYMLNMSSRYSRHIYQMFCQFRGTGELRISVDELKRRLGIISRKNDKDPEKDIYPNFALLKLRVLDVACEEIKKESEFNKVEYETVTAEGSRKVVSLIFRFKINEKKIPEFNKKKYSSVTVPVQLSLLENPLTVDERWQKGKTEAGLDVKKLLLQGFEVSEKQAEEIITKVSYTKQTMNGLLHRLKLHLLDIESSNQKIDNYAAYVYDWFRSQWRIPSKK